MAAGPNAVTATDFFGANPNPNGGTPSSLPTAEQFFAPKQPQSGAAQDTIWSNAASSGARILNQFGYGFQQGWGSEPLGLSDRAESALSKAGVFNDFKNGHTSFLKSANETLIRNAADVTDLVFRRGFGIPALARGIGEAGEQAGEEIEGAHPNAIQKAIAYPLRAGAELSTGVSEGALMGELPEITEQHGSAEAVFNSTREADAAKARSAGVIGEGEAGFYDATPLTPENSQARSTAAQEVGIEPPPPLPPPPDVHSLARRIDPETFQDFDALAYERDMHRQTLAAMSEERVNNPDAINAQGDIDTILGKVRGVEDRLTNAASDRLAAARNRLDQALYGDTPEMAAVRDKLIAADLAMRDLAPQVSEAYRQARDIAPDLPEEAPKGQMINGGEKNLPGEQATEPLGRSGEEPGVPPTEPPPIAASKEAETQVAPPSVTGEQKLGDLQPPENPVAGEKGVSAQGEGDGAPISQKAPTARYGDLKAVQGTGETVQRGLSRGVEANAIEDGLTKAFGDLPEYERVSMKDQAAKVADLVDNDYETAREIAMGDRAPPKGLLPESVFVGVEKRALLEGDVETLRQLATRSRLSTAATTMGQRIRSLGERDKASPVGMIQEVQKAREAEASKTMDIAKAKAETVNEIRSEVQKAASKPAAWEDFIKTIQCDE